MSLALPIILLILSLFLLYQGLCFNGLVKASALFLKKFGGSNILLLLRGVLSKYALLLGVFGLVLSAFLFFYVRYSKDEKSPAPFWGITISYAVFLVFTII